MSLVFGDESGRGSCVWKSGDDFLEESPWNKHISVKMVCPKGQNLCHIRFFTNCDVSRVFGSKSGCWGGCMWNGVDFCPDVQSLQQVNVIGQDQP